MRRALLALLMTFGVAATAFASDVTGKWVGSIETPNGPIEVTYDFKAEADTLTGTVTTPMGSLPLNKGKIAGDLLTYEISLQDSVITHESTINTAGDAITVKATGSWGTNEYVIKRAAAAKQP